MGFGGGAEFSGRGFGGGRDVGNGDDLVSLLEFFKVGGGDFGDGRERLPGTTVS